MGTTPAPLTRDEALDLLAAEVADRPDYVYLRRPDDFDEVDGCVYVAAGVPSCLVGRALARHGWPLEELRALDRANLSARELPPSMADDGARRAFAAAQVNQDGGSTWLTALQEADDADWSDDFDDDLPF